MANSPYFELSETTEQLNQKVVIVMSKKKKMEEKKTIRFAAAEYLTYIAATGDDPQSVGMRYEDENIWITQKMLAVLYDVDVRTVNYQKYR